MMAGLNSSGEQLASITDSTIQEADQTVPCPSQNLLRFWRRWTQKYKLSTSSLKDRDLSNI
jgi:hypothetical protein